MERTLLLEDTFEYKTVPFLVRVEEKDTFINAKNGETTTVNVYGNPAGLNKGGRSWKRCRCYVANVRPDYPYTIEKEWPENVTKHITEVEPMEVPTNGLLFYGTEEVEPERGPQELADDAIGRLKEAYENREKVEGLT